MRTEIDEVVDRLKYEKKYIDHKSISDYYLGRHLFDIGVVAFVRKVKEQKIKPAVRNIILKAMEK